MRSTNALRFASRGFLVLLLGGLLSGASCQGGANGTPTEEPDEPELDAALGAGDVFELRVYGEEELSATYRVSDDGRVVLPFVGAVEAAGRQPWELATDVATGLREGGYLRDPQVSVHVTEYNSRRVSVMGAVNTAGTFAMVPGLTLVQAISLAGGFSDLADRNSTVVTRRRDQSLERFPIRVDDITRGRRRDFYLRAGDIVFVPERVF